MAKVARERAVKERRARKEERKEERKAKAAEAALLEEATGGPIPVDLVDETVPDDPAKPSAP